MSNDGSVDEKNISLEVFQESNQFFKNSFLEEGRGDQNDVKGLWLLTLKNRKKITVIIDEFLSFSAIHFFCI